MSLTADRFGDFYRGVHGWDPFPWQEDLVARVLDRGWPDLVDVPTGLGKTSLLDVSVFVTAATASHRGPGRVGRRRCFFVVDRRMVVDEATVHAHRLAEALRGAERRGDGGVLGDVARALRSLAPDAGGELLPVTRMRGGATWAAAWLDRPDRPGIVLGTVDQVGSRLLFRGYGVSDRRKPIDAALVGTDSLILVDEAHLARALTTTVAAARERDCLGLPLPGPEVVLLTATAAPTDRSFRLDVEAHRAHAEAWRRLNAPKGLRLLEAQAKDLPRVLAETARLLGDRLDAAGRPPAVLVVCNTVGTAREVHRLLVAATGSRRGQRPVDCELLIGRTRPLDRPTVQRRVLALFGIGRERAERPAVLVATQTVEVGVNLDADALVTECASWDALVQRLGRLNRSGRFADRFPGFGPAPAVVVYDGKTDGPVYGGSRDAAWRYLADRIPVLGSAEAAAAFPGDPDAPDTPWGASPLQCREASDRDGPDPVPPEALATAPQVPVLQVPTLDAWAATAPVPAVDPPVDVFLHGFGSGQAGVIVAWRAGLVDDGSVGGVVDPFDPEAGEVPPSDAGTLLKAVPIRPSEQVEVPFLAARRWMRGQPDAPVGDVEVVGDEEERGRAVRESFRVLAERGSAESAWMWTWIEPGDLRPGDQIVVPCERGGLDGYGWAPGSTASVVDVSEAASFVARRSGSATPVLRLDAGLPTRLGLTGATAVAASEALHDLRHPGDDDLDLAWPERGRRFVGALRAALEDQLADGVPGLPREGPTGAPDPGVVHAWLTSGPGVVAVPRISAARVVGGGDEETDPLALLLVGGRLPAEGPADATERDDEDPAASSVGERRVGLEQHLRAVRDRADQIARALGLGPELAAVVRDASYRHDLGKIENRFQVMLHDGDAVEALLAPEPLAKSGLPPGDRAAWRRARRLSGLPPGARHEAWSAALVEEHLGRLAAGGTPYPWDADLLVHLVASHHGHARPWLPLVQDDHPRAVEAVMDGVVVCVPSSRTVSLEHPARFARLNERYGRWGLALLESVVRCADMAVSGEGS